MRTTQFINPEDDSRPIRLLRSFFSFKPPHKHSWKDTADGETFNYTTRAGDTLASATSSWYSLAAAYAHEGADSGNITGVVLNHTVLTPGDGPNSTSETVAVVADAYAYDPSGRLLSVTGSQSATTFGHELGSGALATQTTAMSGDDLVTTNHYNATTGKLESVVTMRGDTLIEEDDYTYPASGAHLDQISRKQVTHLLSDNSTEAYYETYTYDALNQLTSDIRYSGVYGVGSHTTLWDEEFAYDAAGLFLGVNFRCLK
jgi:hypothetical protein